jgi:hypothetical protein
MKLVPYVSTVKVFFHLQTILRYYYVAIPANESVYLIYRSFNRTTTEIKIACKSKNYCKYKIKQLHFLCHPILNNVTVVVCVRLVVISGNYVIGTHRLVRYDSHYEIAPLIKEKRNSK